jgi:hypothetical protein
MAIDRIPGVGPANSDIAAAVAAPSAATIAAAVAAPSSATIASAVAAAVPTLTQINNSVATNSPAAGFGNTYTLLTSGSFSTVSSISLSWSGTYKKLEIVGFGLYTTGTGFGLRLRFNNDSTSGLYNSYSNDATNTTNRLGNGNHAIIGAEPGVTSTGNGPATFKVTIDNPARAEAHYCNTEINSGSPSGTWSGVIGYSSLSALTSVQLFTSGGQNAISGPIYVYGVN